MNKLKRYKHFFSDNLKKEEEFCLSSDVEKLEAENKEYGQLLNDFNDLYVEHEEDQKRLKQLEEENAKLDAQCQTHELRSIQHEADMDALRAENAKLLEVKK